MDAIALYSAFALALDNVDCFFVLQDMSVVPRNTQYLINDMCVSVQDPQSASIFIKLVAGQNIPNEGMPYACAYDDCCDDSWDYAWMEEHPMNMS